MTNQAAILEKKKIDAVYFKGDLAQYTGQVKHLFGGIFYEIELVEGHLKGALRLITKAPSCLKPEG